MKCVKSEEDNDGQKEFTETLCSLALDLNIHVHLEHHIRKPMNEDNPSGKYDSKGSGAIIDQVDNVLIMWRNKRLERDLEMGEVVDPNEPHALLICDKQRNGDWEGRWKLWFERKSTQFLEANNATPINLLVDDEGVIPF
jgi:twinkle protein